MLARRTSPSRPPIVHPSRFHQVLGDEDLTRSFDPDVTSYLGESDCRILGSARRGTPNDGLRRDRRMNRLAWDPVRIGECALGAYSFLIDLRTDAITRSDNLVW